MSFVVCLAPGGGLEPPCPCIAVCLLSLVLGCSCSFPGWEGLAPLCVLCFVAPAPHGGLISVMILSLRPGTRQDPLKNSSGLLAPSVGVSLPRVGPRASWLSATIQHAVGPCSFMSIILCKQRRASLRALWERKESNLRSRLSLPVAAGSPRWRAGPRLSQTTSINLSQNTPVSPCTRVFCICRRSIRLR